VTLVAGLPRRRSSPNAVSGNTHLHSQRALVPLLRFLRGRGLMPVVSVVASTGSGEILAGRFERYLSTQKGLAPATVESYLSQIRPFLLWHADLSAARWESLTSAQVEAFIAVRAVGQRPRSVQVGLTALRVLLRWMWLEALAPQGLADAIGPVATWTPTALPKALTSGQVSDLVTGLSDDAVARCRDEAMLALMWRTGLRAGEVAGLRLQDIDWRTGVLIVRGKGDRHEQVPLPVDVGELLATYLQHSRPVGRPDCRQVFLAVDAPHHRLGAAAVSSVVARAGVRGAVPGACGAHRLRHTAACRVLAGGGGLSEAGQLLRHASAQATAVYARCDLGALSVLVRPWPAQALS
jgi:integrase/recombinase XerD